MLSPINGGIPSSSKDGGCWTKIIMHNVEQFQKDKDAVKLYSELTEKIKVFANTNTISYKNQAVLTG